MKLLINLLLLLMMCLESSAQNLIPNPSFEDHDTCPNAVSQLYYCDNWEQLNITSDYYHACGFGDASFNNYFGIQCPNSGDAYCGSIGLWSFAGIREREIIGSILDSTLIIGQKYYCTYHLSLADKNTWCTGINKFGIKLSTVPFVKDSTLIDNNPFLYSDSVVLDTAGWVQFKYSFIADSAYKYIAFGVFFVDSLLTIDHTLTPVNKTYFYIDDVCLSSDSNTCNFPVVHTCYPMGIDENMEGNIHIFPNPFCNQVTIEIVLNEKIYYRLLDTHGKSIQNGKFWKRHLIDTSELSSGVYCLQFWDERGSVFNKKIIKN